MSTDKQKHTIPTDEKWERIIDAWEAGTPCNNEEISRIGQTPEETEVCKDLMAYQNAMARQHHLNVPDVDNEWERFSRQTNRNTQLERKPHPLEQPSAHRFWWGALTGVAASVIVAVLYTWIAGLPWGKTQVIAFQATEDVQQILLQTSAGTRISLGRNTQEETLAPTGTKLHKKDTLELSYAPETSKASTASEEDIETHVLSTPRGKDFKLVLSDGTTVWMNADSRLEYPSRFVGKNRTVSLQGEAYFKVAKDAEHPFIVQTSRMRATVLGTELNVRNYTLEDSHITLINGRVDVSDEKGERTVSLKPGQDAQWQTDGSFSIKETDVDAYVYWRDGYFYFDNARLVDVMQSIGRWYNINVVFENPQLMDVSIRYFCVRSEPIERAISLLNHMKKMQVTISGNTVYVR